MPRNNGQGESNPATAVEAELPTALMTMTMHMVESRIALMGNLAKCGTVTEAGEVMTRWFEQRIAEFGEDQARVAKAMFTSFAQATAAATDALDTANGLAKTSLEGTARSGRSPH